MATCFEGSLGKKKNTFFNHTVNSLCHMNTADCLEKVIYLIPEVTVLINSCLFGFPITRVHNYYSFTEDWSEKVSLGWTELATGQSAQRV